MSRLVRIFNAIVGLLLVLAAIATWWYAWRPMPETTGSLTLPVAQPATVHWDGPGVPHIHAGSVDDVLFVQGYVTASERFWQMESMRRVAAGELSEVIGPSTLELDQEARRLRMRRVAEAHTRRLRPGDRAAFAAYARGVNHYLETHSGRLPAEFAVLNYDPKPWTVADSVLVGLQMFRSLSSSWREEILKQTLLSQGDPQKVQALFPVRAGNEVHPGSNAWVISGKLSGTGKPILANDTHLEWTFPSTWFVVHLKAADLDVAGFSLPGLPGVLIGHNRRIAWGITNLHFDVQDLYLERFDARTGRYAYRDGIEQARLERESIGVRGRPPVDLNVWVTRHGPVFLTPSNAYFALRWIAAEDGGFVYPFLELDRASNWEEFRKALSAMPGPGSNFVYADIDGNIGYQAAGRFPIRRDYDGDVPSEGAAGTNEWDGWIPFEELPSSLNPASGMVITANQNPFPEQYRYRISGTFASPYRSRQIEARLKSRSGWKPADMASIQTDIYSALCHYLAREVARVWKARGRKDATLSEAAQILAEWNGQMRAEEGAPFLATLVYEQLRRAIADRASAGRGATYDFQMAPAVVEQILRTRPKDWFTDYDQLILRSFVDAVQEGRKLQGDSVPRWRWGRATRMAISHPILSRLPLAGRWFRIGPLEMDGSSTTVKQTTRRLGPSMRFIADLSSWDNSLQQITIGQSGHPLSSHFKDQWDNYHAGQLFPMPFTNVEAKSTLQIEPGR